ncbi:MAG TPA: hypothetical protein GX708_16750 [Gallicola sp.]|nr:hypothetical protein [Gallicola sp.]
MGNKELENVYQDVAFALSNSLIEVVDSEYPRLVFLHLEDKKYEIIIKEIKE